MDMLSGSTARWPKGHDIHEYFMIYFHMLSWYWGYWGCWFKFVDSNLPHPDIRFNSRPRSCDVLGGDGRDEDLPPGVAQFQRPQLAIQIEAQILAHQSYDNKYDKKYENGMKPMAWISWIVRNFTDQLVHYNHYKIWIAPTAFKDSRVPRFRTVEFDGAMEILHIILYIYIQKIYQYHTYICHANILCYHQLPPSKDTTDKKKKLIYKFWIHGVFLPKGMSQVTINWEGHKVGGFHAGHLSAPTSNVWRSFKVPPGPHVNTSKFQQAVSLLTWKLSSQ